MLSAGTDPLRVKTIEIRYVERVNNAAAVRGEGQLVLVGLPNQTSIHSGDHRCTSGTKRRDEVGVHRVFVDVNLDLVHRCGSAPVMCFEGVSLPRLGFQVCVDLHLVGMVVSQSRMDLRQRQVAKLPHDLFWNQAHIVPLSDPPNRNARSGNARPAAANLGTSRDQAAYLNDSCHRLQV
jgi:hypothetical protein